MGICSEAFNKHWILFPTVWHLSRVSQGRTQGRPKCAKNVLKWRTFELMGWITGKRLKIDGYMLRCVWQALNPLSIHVTFIAIVPGAYPGKAKMCKKCVKMVYFWTYRLNYWETVKMMGTSCDAFNKHWIVFSFMWHLPRLSHGVPRGGQNVL